MRYKQNQILLPTWLELARLASFFLFVFLFSTAPIASFSEQPHSIWNCINASDRRFESADRPIIQCSFVRIIPQSLRFQSICSDQFLLDWLINVLFYMQQWWIEWNNNNKWFPFDVRTIEIGIVYFVLWFYRFNVIYELTFRMTLISMRLCDVVCSVRNLHSSS